MQSFPTAEGVSAHVSICQMGIKLAHSTAQGAVHYMPSFRLHQSPILSYLSKVDCYEALNGVVPLLQIMLEDMTGNSQDVASQVFIQM